MKPLLLLTTAILFPLNVHAAMCTGIIVNSPARTLFSGVSNYYEVGSKLSFITQKRVANGSSYYCIWGGLCINTGDLRLHRVMAIKGDPSKMSGREMKTNAYETQEVCTSSSLPTDSE